MPSDYYPLFIVQAGSEELTKRSVSDQKRLQGSEMIGSNIKMTSSDFFYPSGNKE